MPRPGTKSKFPKPADYPIPETIPFKERALVNQVMSHPSTSLSVCAHKVGFTSRQAQHIMDRPYIRDLIGEQLDASGATVEKSCNVIAEAHDAMKTMVIDKRPVKVVDHEYRLRAAELNLRLRQFLSKDASTTDGQPLTLAGLIVQVQQERQRRGLDPLKPPGPSPMDV